MDPDEALRQLVTAFEAGDLDAAREEYEALTGWIGRGGFTPKLNRNQEN